MGISGRAHPSPCSQGWQAIQVGPVRAQHTAVSHIPQTQPVIPKHRTFQDFSLGPLTRTYFLLLWEADKVECGPTDLGRHLAFVRAEPVSEGDVSEGSKAQRS